MCLFFIYFKCNILLLQSSQCGDGVVDKASGEQCDDGNDDVHDECVCMHQNIFPLVELFIVSPVVLSVDA